MNKFLITIFDERKVINRIVQDYDINSYSSEEEFYKNEENEDELYEDYLNYLGRFASQYLIDNKYQSCNFSANIMPLEKGLVDLKRSIDESLDFLNQYSNNNIKFNCKEMI